jgi:hypothetical protein
MELYYLAPELMILVLKELDPVSLLRFCEVCPLYTLSAAASIFTVPFTGMGTCC